jgi:hypothetical protein
VGGKEILKVEFREWLIAFNAQFKTSFRSEADFPNYEYWRGIYSKDEMLVAISMIPQHDWLADKAKPELILRRRDTKGASVDRFGELLSIKKKGRIL